ncbi:MAG TPA: helix-turn-helix domain-containing protein [Planctomycetota bacterium]|nr:helix-turn-helix domain-containing protein [Planctomycetota bacterium]
MLSLPEAAAVLRISLRSLRTLVALGKLPTVRPTARRVLVAESDLAAYIASRRSS